MAQLQQGAPVPDGRHAQHHRSNRQGEPSPLRHLVASHTALQNVLSGVLGIPLGRTSDMQHLSRRSQTGIGLE